MRSDFYNVVAFFCAVLTVMFFCAVLAVMSGSVFVSWLVHHRPVLALAMAIACLANGILIVWRHDVIHDTSVNPFWMIDVFYLILYFPALIGNWYQTRQRRQREARQYAKITRLLGERN